MEFEENPIKFETGVLLNSQACMFGCLQNKTFCYEISIL